MEAQCANKTEPVPCVSWDVLGQGQGGYNSLLRSAQRQGVAEEGRSEEESTSTSTAKTSQWDASWKQEYALVTRTCTYFMSEHCVSDAYMYNLFAVIGTRWWFIVVSLTRKLLFWMVRELERLQSGTWGRLETERHGHISFWSMDSSSCSEICLCAFCKRSTSVGCFRDVEPVMSLHYWIVQFCVLRVLVFKNIKRVIEKRDVAVLFSCLHVSTTCHSKR